MPSRLTLHAVAADTLTAFAVVCALFASPAVAAEAGAAAAVRASPEHVCPEEAVALIAAHKGDNRLVILDLRKKLDFDTAHVEGARHVPYEAGEFEKRIQGFDRESTYLVYCKRGRKVERASRLMKKLRFRRVYILRGGMTRWIDEGRDLVW